MLQRLNDAIDIIVKFTPGRVTPVRFLWQHRSYEIKRINLIHRSGAGIDTIVYFSVSDDVNNFRLAFRTRDFSWTIEELYYDS